MHAQSILSINFSADFQMWKIRKKCMEKGNGKTEKKNHFGVCVVLSEILIDLENPPQFSSYGFLSFFLNNITSFLSH